jgi:hypothetical protein
MLLHEGRQYDSKAIAGAAVGFQYPDAGPLLAKDFSGGEATVKARLESLGFAFLALDGDFTRNPDWTREETILALDLYVRRRPRLPGETDREVIALSELLRQRATQQSIKGNAQFRNPNGVSMKVSNLARLEGNGRVGLPHGAGWEERVWAEFMPDLARLAQAADEIRNAILNAGAVTVLPVAPIATEAGIAVPVSRGPRPSFGSVVHTVTDGETVVYVMRLFGRVAELFPKRSLRGMAVIKLGRTNDIARRVNELNCGFPPGLDLTWRAIMTRTFASADQAHDIEQFLISDLDKRGFAIGREFSIVPEKLVDNLLADAMVGSTYLRF